jgi:aspartate/methionine/tyrosine aminotransferase
MPHLISYANAGVLVVSPSWTTYKPQVQLAHHKPLVVEASESNDWKITPHDLKRAVEEHRLEGNKLLIMCNPDNPSQS